MDFNENPQEPLHDPDPLKGHLNYRAILHHCRYAYTNFPFFLDKPFAKASDTREKPGLTASAAFWAGSVIGNLYVNSTPFLGFFLRKHKN